MSSVSIGLVVFGGVSGAAMLALRVSAALPEHHLSSETKDTVKLAMALVATMTALVLGLLISSAKASYDAEKNEVISMAARIGFLDRLLAMYGPESAPARTSIHDAMQQMVARIWPDDASQPAQLDPRASAVDAVFQELHKLSPRNDEQRAIKSEVLANAYDLGRMRWLLSAQAGSSIPTPLLTVVVFWLAILFFSFGLFAPRNGTSVAAIMVAAMSIAGAIFLILELDRPFGGLIQISGQPMVDTLNHLGK